MTALKEQALFIADSHYPHHGDAFLHLLQKLDSGALHTPQLFLMGDNFDLLFGHNTYIQTFSSEAITLLQTLSKKLEIHYFEGNHDFCLQTVFPDIRVYTREVQPVMFGLDGKKVAIAHGDKYATGFIYGLYCKLLRNQVTLTLLKPFEKWIIDVRMKKLATKHICFSFIGFEKRVEQILGHYRDADVVIEGHFHQAKVLGKYHSLPSLACQGKVGAIVQGEMVFKSI